MIQINFPQMFKSLLSLLLFIHCASLGFAQSQWLNVKKWAFNTGGAVESSPAIGSDGTIYVGSSAAWPQTDGRIYAINPDGSKKWSIRTKESVSSSPTIGKDGTIYIASLDEKLHAINPDGSVKWRHSTIGWPGNPVVANDGTIYVKHVVKVRRTFNWEHIRDAVDAINPDGSKKWEFSLRDVSFASPVISSDGTIYLGASDRTLYAINSDGSKKWEYNTGDLEYKPLIGKDGTIYVRARKKYLHAINTDGSKKWAFKTDDPVHCCDNSSIADDGTIYLGAGENLYAINPDGSKKWAFEANDRLFSPAIGKDGTIYIRVGYNNLYAINPDGSQKWKSKPASISSITIGIDGTIYIGSDDHHLYAINVYETNISDKSISKGQSLTLQYFPQPTFTYQWFYNAKEIPGATSISYTIENADLEDSGTYVLAIMDQTGKVRLYKPAVITVVLPHNITDQEIEAGESLTLAIEQAPNTTYQWFKNNMPIQGANSPNLKLENTQAKDTGLYSLKVISQSGETSKFEANINVLSPPVITAEPISLAIAEGESFKLDTTVIGTEPLSFQWYRDGEAIEGANSNYLRSVKGESIPGNYKLIIKNEYGSVESREVQITEGVGIEIEIGKEGHRQIILKAKPNESNWMIESSSNLINWTVLAPMKKRKVFDGIEKKWVFETGDNVDSSPAIGSDGTIYVGSEDNNLYAINPDGSKKWNFKTGGGVDSSPTIGSDGTIYVGSEDNNLYAINPDGSKKWAFKTGFTVDSSPAIGSNGTIYVGSWS
ncbi:PQQ-binding-like beta-propeller repeat protein [Verrucomicrobia bacterium]|nr:PQQ-binding-like beta-propeller repeat protein [Verrucomicrobiota bacterium]